MSVDHGTYLQIAQLCEALATVFELTVEGFHLLMYDEVRPHVAGLREAPVAKTALKRSLTGVPSFVRLTRLIYEARRAHKDFSPSGFPSEKSTVHSQLLCISIQNFQVSEVSASSSDKSYVWLIPCVCADMDIQAASLRENLST